MKKWISHDTDDGDWVVDMPHDPACTVQRLWFGDMETNTGADIDRANYVARACDAYDDVLRELAWIVTQWDDTTGSAELAHRLYNVTWTARWLLAKVRGETST